jgi:hypothetical protein
MFIVIDKDPVNIDHIVNCHPSTSGVTTIYLSSGKTYNIGSEIFQRDILPNLLMASTPSTYDQQFFAATQDSISGSIDLGASKQPAGKRKSA